MTPAADNGAEALALARRRFPFAYVPRFYEPEYADDGRFRGLRPTRAEAASTIEPSVIGDLESAVLPLAPILPAAECVHDRIVDRDHARLPVAMSLLPEHRDQAAAADSLGRQDRRQRFGDVSQHGPRRSVAPVAFEQRLPVLRRARQPNARDVRAARRDAWRCRACA